MSQVAIDDFLSNAARVAIGSLMGKQQAQADLAQQQQEAQQEAAKQQAAQLAQQHWQAAQDRLNQDMTLRKAGMARQGYEAGRTERERRIGEQQKLLPGATPESAQQIQANIQRIQAEGTAADKDWSSSPYAQYYGGQTAPPAEAAPQQQPAPTPAPGPTPAESASWLQGMHNVGGQAVPREAAPTPFPRQSPEAAPAPAPAAAGLAPWLTYAPGTGADGQPLTRINEKYVTGLRADVEKIAGGLRGLQNPKAGPLLKEYAKLAPNPQTPADFEAYQKFRDAAAALPSAGAEAAGRTEENKWSGRVNAADNKLAGLPVTPGQQRALEYYRGQMDNYPPGSPEYVKAAQKYLAIVNDKVLPSARQAKTKADAKAKLQERQREEQVRRDEARQRAVDRQAEARQRELDRRADARQAEMNRRADMVTREGYSEKRQQAGFQHTDTVRAARGTAGKGGRGDKTALQLTLKQIEAQRKVNSPMTTIDGIPIQNRKYSPDLDRQLRQKEADAIANAGFDPSAYLKANPDLKATTAAPPPPSRSPGASPGVDTARPAAPPARRVRANGTVRPTSPTVPAAAPNARVSPPGRTRISDGYVPAPLRGMDKETLKSALYALKQAEQSGLTLTIPPHGGFRSEADQKKLYAGKQQHPEQYPYPVAKPGESVHQLGKAMDVTNGGTATLEGQRALAHVLEPLGWQWAGPADMVHFNFLGAPKAAPVKTAAAPKAKPAPAAAAPPRIYNFASGKADWNPGGNMWTVPAGVKAVNREGNAVWIDGGWRPFTWVNREFRLVNPVTHQPFPVQHDTPLRRQALARTLAQRGASPAQIQKAMALAFPGGR